MSRAFDLIRSMGPGERLSDASRLAIPHILWSGRVLGLAVLCLLTLVVVTVFPVAAIAAVVLFIGINFRSPSVGVAVGTVVITALFAWMNSHKGIQGDWAWYTHHFLWLQHMSFMDYWGQKFGPFTIKLNEPVYYFLSFVTAKLSNGYVPLLAWVVSSLIYGSLGAAVGLLLRPQITTSLEGAVVVLVALMMGVTFTLTTQLVRQEIAAAFLVLGWAIWQRGPIFAALVVVLFGLLSHSSSLVPALCVSVTSWFAIRECRISWPRVIALWCLFLGAGLLFVKTSGGGIYDFQGKSDGNVSFLVYGLDVAIFMAFVWARSRLQELTAFARVLMAVVLVYSGFLIGVCIEPLLLLRMYFYVEAFRTLMVACIAIALFRSRSAAWTLLPIMIGAIAYVELRIAVSPFQYGGGVIAHLLRPFAFYQ